MRGYAAIVMSVLAVAGVASAATMTPSLGDGRVQTSGGAPAADDTGDYACVIGEYYAPGGSNYVMPFQLPILGAGEQFTSASLRMQLYDLHNNPAAADADLYGLGRRAADTVLASDYYQGATADPSATLIQAAYLTSASTVRTDANAGPFINTTGAGDAALVSYLNAQYANGAGGGQYVFLRLSPHLDAVPAGWNAYAVLTADAGGANERPLLTYEVAAVPEPVSIGILGLSATGLLMRRRKQA